MATTATASRPRPAAAAPRDRPLRPAPARIGAPAEQCTCPEWCPIDHANE